MLYGLKAVVRRGARAAETPAPRTCIIAVPTPLTADKRADMRHVAAAAEALTPFLRPWSLLIPEVHLTAGHLRGAAAPDSVGGGENGGGCTCFWRTARSGCCRGAFFFTDLVENDRVIRRHRPGRRRWPRDTMPRFVKGLFLTDATNGGDVK